MEKISHHHHADAASPDLAEMSPSRKLRTERRRNQILDAADAVFQTHGFHAASMAKVAAEADMSVGHIYRYFENKEAVITAISERDLERSRETIEAMLNDPAGLSAAMLAGVDRGVAEMMDRPSAARFLEVMAEAARNSKVAESVRLQHEALLVCVRALFAESAARRGRYSVAEAVDLMGLIFNGLRIRAIQDPDADLAALSKAIRTFVADLIGEG